MGTVRPPGPALVLAAAALVAAAGCAPGGSGGDADGPPAGRAGSVQAAAAARVADPASRPEAPEVSGERLDGRPLALAEFRGQVVVLNVWGSWCAPCRTEAGDLARLSRATRAEGVRFLGINTRDRDRSAARAFVSGYGLDFPSLYDPAGELLLRFPPGQLNPQTIPSTLVIDRRGRVAAAIGGPVTEEQLRPLVTRVAQEAP
ncbi:TlpA family protein disulfide reductase [Streptomyces sp. NPDC012888]|uniref:TlpA family protein disulfide reductase n=1 Tax=Streptomyces sp. NPDC012888 TaxID=3364855 RepID=UPI003676BAF3